MSAIKVRSFNPIWFNVDLSALAFDDTYYLFVLQNTLPYLPATVWHDDAGNTPWVNPIRYLANGTLPVDIYWDEDTVYRLEFRKGATQQDPLIYVVENYTVGTSGEPFDTIGVNTDNQITNPQFSLISFNPPKTFSTVTNPDPIDVAPGWELIVTGTGNITLDRLALNSAIPTPTNAPYALRVTLTGGFTTAKMRQKFHQNGVLWSGKYVSSSVTARSQNPPQSISARLVDSQGAPLATILPSTALTSTFTEYEGFGGLLPPSTNTDTPPAAYIAYELVLPVVCDIYLTSFQVLASDVPAEFDYLEDTIDRQIDHTWHVYKDDVLIKPKDSILVGWNFPLNPWQFTTTAVTTLAAPNYTADQTIVLCENNSSIATSRLTNGQFNINAVAAQAQGKFGLLQYVDAASVIPYWASMVSSLAQMSFTTTNGTLLRLKMRLLYRSDVPPAVNPITAWNGAGTDPTFTAGWTALAPINDPIYTVGSTLDNYLFEGFVLPTQPAATAMFGILLYSDNVMSSAGTPDALSLQSISLVPGRKAAQATVQSYDQTLRQCQFYYEKTYDPFVLPGTPATSSYTVCEQYALTVGGTNDVVRTRSFGVRYQTPKRTVPQDAIYSPVSGTVGNVYLLLRRGGTTGAAGDLVFTNWSLSSASQSAISYVPANATNFLTTTTTSDPAPEGLMFFEFISNALLGVVP